MSSRDKKQMCFKVSVTAVLAGVAIMEIYEKYLQSENDDAIGLEYKEGKMPLTLADQASNAVIVKALRESYPEIAILSEEEKDDRSRLSNPDCFVVDPLDGTKEFIKKNGQFTVNIALSEEHESTLGVIYVPVTGELYYAAKGLGAKLIRLDAKKLQAFPSAERLSYIQSVFATCTPEKLSVSDRTEDLRVVMSSSHGCAEMDALLEKYHLTNFVKMGSSLKGCVIAKGEAEVYYRHNPTMEWDTAAMQCIVEEAGAIFMQLDETPMRYNRENSLNDKGFYIINCEKNHLV